MSFAHDLGSCQAEVRHISVGILCNLVLSLMPLSIPQTSETSATYFSLTNC